MSEAPATLPLSPPEKQGSRRARWALVGTALALAGGGFLVLRTLARPRPVTVADLVREIARHPRLTGPRLDLAASYASAGDPIGAIEQLEAVRGNGGRDEALFDRLAGLYRGIGEPSRAAEVLQSGVALLPQSVRLRDALSDAQLSTGDFAAAADTLLPGKTTPSGRTTEPARLKQARQLLLAGRWEEVRALLPDGGGDPEALALLGLRAMLAGEGSTAVGLLRAATDREPGDTWNRYLLGRAYLRARKTAEALTAFQRASLGDDPPARAGIEAARLLVSAKRTTEAAAVLRQAERGSAEDPQWWRARALVDRTQGRPVALDEGYASYYSGDPWTAEQTWTAALAPGAGLPDDAARSVYAALIQSAELRLDHTAALRTVTEALGRWPDDAAFLRRRADLLLGENRYAEALAAGHRFEKVVAPDQAADAADLLARIALDSGEEPLLQQQAQRYQIIKPGAAAPVLLLAEWQKEHSSSPDHRERALQLYERAVAIDPDDAEANASLGGLLAELKRPDEAVPRLRHALARDPTVLDGTPSVQLAMIYRRRGQTAEATLHEERFQRLRRLKSALGGLLPILRGTGTAAQYRELGEVALARNNRWLALIAFRKGLKSTNEPELWRGLAAAQKRLGQFEEALDSMRRYELGRRAGQPGHS